MALEEESKVFNKKIVGQRTTTDVEKVVEA
jgi:hypothetical protein